MPFDPPGPCPNCGEPVSAGARACPECGADAKSGWNDDTYLDGIDLPGEDRDFDRERFAARESGSARPRGAKAWFALALCVVIALVLSGLWWLL